MRTYVRLCFVTAFLWAASSTAGQVPGPRTAPTVASCGDQRNVAAVTQTVGVNVVLNRAAVWIFDFDWMRVDFESWSKNLDRGWKWDGNQFGMNLLAHPYNGSLYFGAARANCLSFWESVPMVFLGSWTWEFFGEIHRASLNDFFVTGFGGVALGEILYRASAAVRDEEAEGGERIARELAATIIDPLGGLNRLVRGQWTGRGVNPVDRIPESYLFRANVGGRRVEEAGSPAGPTSSPTLLVDFRLGDVFETEYRAPFDVVDVLAQVSPDGGGLNLARAVGRLYGKELTAADSRHRHQVVINQRFDYINNPAYHFGEQSLEAGLQSRWRVGPGGLRLSSRLAGDVVVLGAIEALASGLGQRDMDWGPGLGAIAELALERNGTTYVSFYNRVRYLWPVSGAPADHTLLFSGFDVTIPITSRLGIGAYVSGDRRHSTYADFPDEDQSYVETRVYLTWTLAHRTPERSR